MLKKQMKRKCLRLLYCFGQLQNRLPGVVVDYFKAGVGRASGETIAQSFYDRLFARESTGQKLFAIGSRFEDRLLCLAENPSYKAVAVPFDVFSDSFDFDNVQPDCVNHLSTSRVKQLETKIRKSARVGNWLAKIFVARFVIGGILVLKGERDVFLKTLTLSS